MADWYDGMSPLSSEVSTENYAAKAAALRSELIRYQETEKILFEQFAKGEIEKEEALKKLKEQNDNIVQQRREGNISRLLQLQKEYLISIATDQDDIETELEIRSLRRKQEIHDAEMELLRDRTEWEQNKEEIISQNLLKQRLDAEKTVFNTKKRFAELTASFKTPDGINANALKLSNQFQEAEISRYNEYAAQKMQDIQDELAAKGELYKWENGQRVLNEEAMARAIEARKAEFDAAGEGYKKYLALQDANDKKKKEKEAKEKKENSKAEAISNFKTAFGASGQTFKERKEALKSMATGEDGEFSGKKLAASLVNGIADLAKQLENKMDEAGSHKAPIDTRLYGSNNKKRMGSYWDQLSADTMSIAGASPLLLQTDMIASLEKLVGQGISHNLKLRAFLDATAEKIATTFDVSNGTMLRLIRIQNQDSTAARMGMEASLTQFLNSMYETTEYLSNLATSVKQNLEEAQALMGADAAAEFEFIAQKWFGSMSSVGMSDSAVSSISTALGQLAAGQIDALTNGGAGNLMIMAANRAEDVSIGDILKDGLDADKTNKLLEATVAYLAEIADSSDSRVVQQQLAGIFGISASDLKAIVNLKTDANYEKLISKSLNYEGMVAELSSRAASMIARTSIGEMMTNAWENVQYSMASSMSNNPITYLLYKVGGLLEQTTGGIDLPFLNVYGFGVDLNTTVAQLMQVGAMAGGVLGSLGNMVSAIGNMAGGGAAMLMTAGLAGAGENIRRGRSGEEDATKAQKGKDVSNSGSLVANGSGSDVENSTMAGAADSINSQSTQGKEDNEDATRDDIIEILKMLFGILGKKIDDNTETIKLESSKTRGEASTTTAGFTNASTNRMMN